MRFPCRRTRAQVRKISPRPWPWLYRRTNQRLSHMHTLAEAPMLSPTKAMRLLALSIGVFLACLPLFAQTYTGRILGTVTDQTGAALTGAEVVITDVQRGVTRTLTTDQAGEYVAPDLSPGMYKVQATAKGFKSVER